MFLFTIQQNVHTKLNFWKAQMPKFVISKRWRIPSQISSGQIRNVLWTVKKTIDVFPILLLG